MTDIPEPLKRQINAMVDGADDNLVKYRGRVRREKATPEAIYAGLEEIKAAMSKRFNGAAGGSDCFDAAMAYGNARLIEKFKEYFPDVMKQYGEAKPAELAPALPDLPESVRKEIDTHLDRIKEVLSKPKKPGESSSDPMIGGMIRHLRTKADEAGKKKPKYRGPVNEYLSQKLSSLVSEFPQLSDILRTGPARPAEPEGPRAIPAEELVGRMEALATSLREYSQGIETSRDEKAEELIDTGKAIEEQALELTREAKRLKKRPLVRSGYITTLLLTALGALGHKAYEEMREDARDQQSQIIALKEALVESEDRYAGELAGHRDEARAFFSSQEKELDKVADRFIKALESHGTELKSYRTELTSLKETHDTTAKAAEAKIMTLTKHQEDLSKIVQTYIDLDTKATAAAKTRADEMAKKLGDFRKAYDDKTKADDQRYVAKMKIDDTRHAGIRAELDKTNKAAKNLERTVKELGSTVDKKYTLLLNSVIKGLEAIDKTLKAHTHPEYELKKKEEKPKPKPTKKP